MRFSNESGSLCEDKLKREALSLGQPKVNKVKIFILFKKFMKRPQTKFHAGSMSDSKVIRSKKGQNLLLGQNLSLGQNFLQNIFSLSIFY